MQHGLPVWTTKILRCQTWDFSSSVELSAAVLKQTPQQEGRRPYPRLKQEEGTWRTLRLGGGHTVADLHLIRCGVKWPKTSLESMKEHLCGFFTDVHLWGLSCSVWGIGRCCRETLGALLPQWTRQAAGGESSAVTSRARGPCDPGGKNLELEAPNQPARCGAATGCPTAWKTTHRNIISFSWSVEPIYVYHVSMYRHVYLLLRITRNGASLGVKKVLCHLLHLIVIFQQFSVITWLITCMFWAETT